MDSFPSPRHTPPPAPTRFSRTRDERGAALPSPVALLSVVAVAVASITFVATRDQAPTERRVDTATVASAEASTPPPAPPTADAPTEKPEPRVVRKDVYVEVYNNSGIKGLAASTAATATQVGWSVVGEDNWYGAVPASTVYFPPRLKAAGKQLALDLGLRRTAPAVGAMKRDRLTVILTADAAS